MALKIIPEHDIALIFYLEMPVQVDDGLDNVMGYVYRTKNMPEDSWNGEYRFRYYTSGSLDAWAKDKKSWYELTANNISRDKMTEEFMVPFELMNSMAGGELFVGKFEPWTPPDDVLDWMAQQDWTNVREEEDMSPEELDKIKKDYSNLKKKYDTD